MLNSLPLIIIHQSFVKSMDQTANFQETSYLLHENNHALKNGDLTDDQKSWLRNDTVDFWRHDRMYKPLSPLLKNNPKTKWLTVGDARLGLDSIKLKNIEPTLDILPVDISTVLLEYAKKNNLITNYAKENAEKLSFADNTFDFAFCKESFHHFPRPYIALYEMIRVAKNAVILIEPNEIDILSRALTGRLWIGFKQFIKKIIGKKNLHIDTGNFETVGNYVYTVSKREIEKVALGIGLTTVAFYYFNDVYIYGTEFEKAESSSILFKKIKAGIRKKDIRSKLGIDPYKNIITIIFKQKPSEKICKELVKNKFEIVQLPENPYIAR
ncbi:MAG TPA: class I SAM-dependent methyltransferase [Chitinophagaceae bacterium]|jgi:ubiquinone/menaquinone biosynthesis C-methylase UbiE|nr:class I SAM-dependent methyltransferase [Chitinophagaceae bacterium]